VGYLRRLIVFDLDGTLVDSRRDLATSANALILERGGQPLAEDAIGRMVGEGAAVLVERALTAAGLAFDTGSVARFLELYDDRLLETTRTYEGIPEAVAALAKGGPVAVLTNKPAAPSRRILDGLGLSPLLSAIIGGDSPFPKKPAPEALRHLMAEFGVTADRTVLVGDSRIDHETAHRAGTAVCLARYGYGYETFPAEALRGGEALVDAASAIPEAVDRLVPPGVTGH
jgi:phosphoglycolate phosphatase